MAACPDRGDGVLCADVWVARLLAAQCEPRGGRPGRRTPVGVAISRHLAEPDPPLSFPVPRLLPQETAPSTPKEGVALFRGAHPGTQRRDDGARMPQVAQIANQRLTLSTCAPGRSIRASGCSEPGPLGLELCHDRNARVPKLPARLRLASVARVPDARSAPCQAERSKRSRKPCSLASCATAFATSSAGISVNGARSSAQTGSSR